MAAFRNPLLPWLAALVICPSLARAASTQVIEFPKEELASESVLPVFDHPEATKLRLVTTAKRLELGAFGSYALTEALFNPMSFGGMATYHFDETNGINLIASFNLGGTTHYNDQLNSLRDSTGSPIPPANFQYAPAPKYLVLASYQFTAFYGKISLTKEGVMNLHLYGLGGLGMMGVGDTSVPVASLGIGQKFYLTRDLALRFDLRGIVYNGPDPVSRNLSNATSVQPAANFDTKLQFGTLLSVGAVYLLPSF